MPKIRNIFKFTKQPKSDWTTLTVQNFETGTQIQVQAQTVEKTANLYAWVKNLEAYGSQQQQKAINQKNQIV